MDAEEVRARVRSGADFFRHAVWIAKESKFPLRSRLDLLALEVVRRLPSRESFTVRYPPGRVYLRRNTLDIDLVQMFLVWSRQPYATSYADARVLDIGAHKGYYGAYGLARGAHSVRSYEPESRNFEALELAAASFRARGADWTVERAAVAAEPGTGELAVSRDSSSAHSLVAQSGTAEDSAEREVVSVVPAEKVLRELTAGGNQRVIVKVDAEGAECDIFLGTPAELWRSVDEIFVEVHGFARCTAEDIATHLASAGLVLREEFSVDPHVELHFVRG